MSKSENKNIKVFFRIFPMEKMCWDYLKVVDKIIYMRYLQNFSDVGQKQKPLFWEFKTNGIFLNNDQKFIYSNVMDGVLERVAEGHNSIIIAFGQTGTGKTVTLGGLQLSEEDFGITPRAIYDIFKIKNELPKNIKMSIQISYTEFSTSMAVDLLKEYPNYIDVYHSKEATKIKVTSEYEALKLLYIGEGRKYFACNNAYLANLRSSVFTFYITTANMDFTNPRKVSSKLHVIDLAGVDTIGSASSTLKHPPDIGRANIIKTNLEQFILCLKENIPFHIKLKERTNPLIYFLGSDLCNETILRFVGHIRIRREDLIITLSMLRFGQLVRGLKPKQKEIIHEMNESIELQYLQNQLEDLEREKIQNSVLLNQDLTQNLNQDRMEHIQTIIQDYLKGHITEINVLNVAEASEVFKIFKQLCNECEAEKTKLSQEAQLELSLRNKHGSKTSSKSSLRVTKGSNKRSSKKSKESFISNDKLNTEKSASAHSVPARRKSSAAGKLTPKKSSLSGSQANKRRPSSLGVLKRSSMGKRRSTTSTSIAERKESKSSEIILMPDNIPEYPEAWNLFVSDNDCFYKTLLEEYRANENEIQSVYIVYLTEMKKLQCHKEVYETRKNEILEAQMISIFNISDNIGSSEEHIAGNSEALSHENFNTAQQKLVEQQEIVLKWQSELKICLNKRLEIRKQLNEEFEMYCKYKFSVPIPDLDDEGTVEETAITIELQDEDTEDSKCVQKDEDKTIKLNRLKKIMERELRKSMKLKAKKHNMWKKYF